MRSHVRLMLAMTVAAAVAVPVAGATAAASPPTSAPGRQSSAVLDWNATATSAAVACGITPDGNPPFEARVYAMTHIAVHDALNEIRPVYRSYAYSPAGSRPSASAEAAVAAAARDVLIPGLHRLVADCPSELVQDTYTARLAAIPAGPAKEQGIAIGRAAAAKINALRAADLTGPGFPVARTDFLEGPSPANGGSRPGRTSPSCPTGAPHGRSPCRQWAIRAERTV